MIFSWIIFALSLGPSILTVAHIRILKLHPEKKNKMLKKCIRVFIITVLFLPLVLTSYIKISEFNDPSSIESESVHELAVRLIRMCFADTNRLITLSDTISKKLAEEMNKSEFTALTIMSIDSPTIDKDYTMAKQSRKIYNNGFYFRFEQKAQGFIMAAASQPILRHQIKELKNSRWWKAAGLLMIIDDGTTIINSCKNAKRFMWQAWRFNMLSSVFLCRDANKKLMIYSYNPYNSMAPKNWLKIGEYLGRYGHPWILFKRNATDSPKRCSDIFFDKTKTLDNYKIRSNSVSMKPRLSIDYNKTGLERYAGEEGEVIQTIFRFLNASIDDIPYNGKDPVGYFDEDATHFGMLDDIFSGKADINLNGRYMISMWKLGMTYSHAEANICFLLKSKGNIPQWMNLLFVFDVWITLGLITATLLTILILSYYTNVSDSFMNSLRLVISTSLIRLPSNLPARFFLINVFLLFFIANSMFQGRWTSLLTKPRAYGYPETQTDLGNAGYKVAGYPPYSKYIDDPVLRSHFVASWSLSCDHKTESYEDIACVMDCDTLYMNVDNPYKFHIVSQQFQKFKIVFATSEDWPLYDRFNRLIKRLLESGLPDYWRVQDLQIAITSQKRDKFLGENRSPFLSLSDLAFIFYFLLFCLQIATLVFLYEVISIWYRMRFNRIG